MPQPIEVYLKNFIISTDNSRLDLDAVVDMLSRAYWASGRTREIIAHSIEHSLVFGLYDGSRQIGMARIVSDYATFAWLCDVFIHEDYRGQGLGKWLMEAVTSHPDLQGLRRILLATRDAHGLYAQFGWKPLSSPERWMEKFNG
jgi:GNAT superfamily N-acetyltransferase